MYVSVLSHYLVQEPILTALLIAHFLSDFTFQSQQLANAKRTNFLALVLHLTVVGIPLSILAFLLPINNGDLFFSSLAKSPSN